MTGWRVGYIAAPKWIADGCNKVQGQITSANCSIAQRAALAAISGDQAPTYKMVDEYKKRRDIVYNLLKEIPGIKSNYPQGAFYFFLDVRPLRMTSLEICERLLDEAGVGLVPGSAFGEQGEGFLRMTIAASDEDVEAGFRKIVEWAEKQ